MFTKFTTFAALSILVLAPIRDFGVEAHVSLIHPSMWGFNITSASDPHFSYDNRPVAPLADYTFQQWWMHGHLDFPPNEGDVFQLPAGGVATTEIACTKSATSFFDPANGGDIRRKDNPNDPCPGSGMEVYHTQGFNDLKGCGLAIAYESDVSKVQPEDMTIFSINQTCVWTRFTDFAVPARMPVCPPGGCTCAWMWIHSEDSGSEQNYMTGFKCNITNAVSQVPLAKAQVPRRCGADPKHGVPQATPGNCTYGAKQPLYWFQKERNNVFEDQYAPPFYNDLYNFRDGAQDDIFADSYEFPLPVPSVNQTLVPKFFKDGTGASGTAPSSTTASQAVSSSSRTPQATQSLTTGGNVGTSPSSALASSTAAPPPPPPTTSAVVTSTKVSVVTATQTVVVVATSTAVVTVSASATPSVRSTSTSIVFVLPSPTTSFTPPLSSSASAFPITTIKLGNAAPAAEPTSLENQEIGLKAAVLAGDPSNSGSATQQNLKCHSKRDGSGSIAAAVAASGQRNVQRRANAFHATNSFKQRRVRKNSDLWRIF